MGFHGSGVFCLYSPLMLLLQFQIFGKYVLCVFSLVGIPPQKIHISSYVAHPMFYSCKLVTQVVHFFADQFHYIMKYLKFKVFYVCLSYLFSSRELPSTQWYAPWDSARRSPAMTIYAIVAFMLVVSWILPGELECCLPCLNPPHL